MPCEQNLDCYHFLFDKNGKEYKGKYKPEDNLNCTDGIYAKHCGGGNTGCIGVSCCGMYGFNLQNKKTKYPLTQKQVETMCAKVAKLCTAYGIPVTIKPFLLITNSVKPTQKQQVPQKLILHIFHICQILQKTELAII